MATTITTHAQEESTFKLTCAFTDDDGDAVTPKAITWTLSTDKGKVVNEREDETVATPSTSIDIVLSGDDLQILGGETGATATRHLTVKSTYDSDAGTDLPSNAVAIFEIDNLSVVT